MNQDFIARMMASQAGNSGSGGGSVEKVTLNSDGSIPWEVFEKYSILVIYANVNFKYSTDGGEMSNIGIAYSTAAAVVERCITNFSEGKQFSFRMDALAFEDNPPRVASLYVSGGPYTGYENAQVKLSNVKIWNNNSYESIPFEETSKTMIVYGIK